MRNKSTLGQKIKYFRKEKGISQSQLETDGDFSYGMISRIESDKINPTKETVLKIAEILGLGSKEIEYLISPKKVFVTQEEIQKVIEKVSKYFKETDRLVYLLDNLRRVQFGGNKIVEALGLSKETASRFFGTHIIEIITNPALGFRDLIKKEDFEGVALSRTKSFQVDLKYLIDNGEFDEYLKRWKTIPGFTELWEKAKGLDIDPIEFEKRKFSLKLGNNYKNFYFSVIPVEYDRRFEIIEFIES